MPQRVGCESQLWDLFKYLPATRKLIQTPHPVRTHLVAPGLNWQARLRDPGVLAPGEDRMRETPWSHAHVEDLQGGSEVEERSLGRVWKHDLEDGLVAGEEFVGMVLGVFALCGVVAVDFGISLHLGVGVVSMVRIGWDSLLACLPPRLTLCTFCTRHIG